MIFNEQSLEFAKLQQPQPWSFPLLFATSSLPTVPSTFLSTRLVTFAVEALGFLHGTIHGPSFLQEHSRFIEEKDTQGVLFMGTAWLGFYFSQLTLALHHLPPLTIDAWGIHGRLSLFFPIIPCTRALPCLLRLLQTPNHWHSFGSIHHFNCYGHPISWYSRISCPSIRSVPSHACFTPMGEFNCRLRFVKARVSRLILVSQPSGFWKHLDHSWCTSCSDVAD